MHKRIVKLIPLCIFIICLVGAYLSGVLDYVSFETIQEKRTYLSTVVEEHFITSAFAFSGLYVLTVALSLPIASLLTLLGGFLFGLITGTILIVTSATIGAAIIFLIAKSAIGETLRDKAGPFYNKVAKNMNDNALQYMFFTRLVLVVPFFVANILPALFNIKLKDFMLTTFLGIIPGTVVYVNIGRGLATIESPSDLISPQVLGAFTLLGLFALFPTVIKWIKNKKSTT